ncbi:NAD-binding protein [candidate division KSB1 bacterium]|nr:NAD-binding protein [candidate division KSB1 bacterium]
MQKNLTTNHQQKVPPYYKVILNKFINHPITEYAIIILILLSVAIIIADIAQLFSEKILAILNPLGEAITIIFIIELSIRFWVAKNRRQFWIDYFLDILSVIPLLRIFRILRVLRILRLGIILRRRILTFSTILYRGFSEQFLVLIMIIIIVLTGAMGMSHYERQVNPGITSFQEALWWSLMSLIAGEPIGTAPVTTVGKFFTLIVMIGGMSIFAIFTGIISAVMVQRLKSTIQENGMNLNVLEQHIIICGWNRAGRIIVEELQVDKRFKRRDIVIVAEFENESHLHLNYDNILREKIYFLSADYTNVNILQMVGVQKASVAILLADKSRPRTDQDRDARTILAALTIEKMNPAIYTCVELLNRDNDSHLKMIGVEEIVVGDEYSGNVIAASSKNLGIIPILDELLTSRYGNTFFKMRIPFLWVGKKVSDIIPILKNDYEAMLLALECSSTQKSMVNPPAGTILGKDDQLVIIAEKCPEIL